MTELTKHIRLDLTGNLSRRARAAADSLTGLGRRGDRALARLARGAQRVDRSIGGMVARAAGLTAGVGLGAAVRHIGALEERFTRLGIQAQASDAVIGRLRERVYQVAQAPDIRVDPGELTSAIEKIVEKTGDLDFATDNMRTLGLAIQAAGARGQDVGALIAEFKKLGIETEAGVLRGLDTLVAQGKAGAFTLQHLAAQGERVVSAYAGMGFTGQDAVQHMGALVQVARMGTGGAEQATTAYEALLRTITQKSKDLHAVDGVEVFDEAALARGETRFRSIPAIMKQVLAITEADITKLSGVFDAEAIKALTVAAAEYKREGGFASLDKFLAIDGDGETLEADAARAAQTFNASLTALTTAAEQFAETNLAEPVQALADAIGALKPEPLHQAMRGLAWGAAAAGGLMVGAKAVRGIAWAARGIGAMRGRRRGGGAAGGAALGAISAAAATPVYVVNWPLGGLGGGLGGGSHDRARRRGRSVIPPTGKPLSASAPPGRTRARGAPPQGIGRLSAGVQTIGGAVARRAGPLGLVVGGAHLASAVAGGDAQTIGASAGSLGGGLGGAAAGAAIGSLILPGLGTIAGGLIGGIAGSLSGSSLGAQLGAWFDDDTPTPAAPADAAPPLDDKAIEQAVAAGVETGIRRAGGVRAQVEIAGGAITAPAYGDPGLYQLAAP